MTRRRENRVEETSDSWVILNSWSMAADCPLAARAPDEEFRSDPLMDACPLEDACERIVAADFPVWEPGDMPMVVTKFASDAAEPLAELLLLANEALDFESKVHTSRLLVLSSTAASRRTPPVFVTARPKAPPGFGSRENWPTNLPPGVNSTSSLAWFESSFTVLTASPLEVIRSPLGANTSPSGPKRCLLSW